MKKYQLSKEESDQAKAITNPIDIAQFWKQMGDKYLFNPKTVKFLQNPAEEEISFEAQSTEVVVLEAPDHDYNSFGKKYAIVVTGSPEGDLNAKIAEWKAKFGELKIADENDKSGYLAVQSAISQIRTVRGLVEAKRKELKKDPIELGKLIDGTAKNIIDSLLPLEEELKAEKERIDAIKEEQKQKKLQEIEDKFNQRVKVLQANGMEFTGGGYALNDVLVSTLQIKTFTEKEWDEFLAKVQKEWSEESVRREEAKKLEAEQKAKEEKEKLVSERTLLLTSLGFEDAGPDWVREYLSKAFSDQEKSLLISKESIGELSAEDWTTVLKPVYGDGYQQRVWSILCSLTFKESRKNCSRQCTAN